MSAKDVQAGGDIIGRDQITINMVVGESSSPLVVDRRAAEQGYLKQLIQQYEYWAEKYTPLAGITEVRKAAADGPRLDLPNLFMPTGFEKLTAHGFGERQEIKREPVDDLLARRGAASAPRRAGRPRLRQDNDPLAADL